MTPDLYRRPTRRVIVGAVVAVASAVLATWHSYHRSISLTFCDATLTTDEGALKLTIPLVKLAAKQKFDTSVTVFRRSRTGWEASNGMMKVPLDIWMASNRKWPRGWSLADFGYYRYDWQSEARPGPCLAVFVPIWFVFGGAFLAFASMQRNWWRWSIRSMLVMTAVVGVCLWLLTRREQAAG